MPKELTIKSTELLNEDGVTFLRIRLSNDLVIGANLTTGMDINGLIEQTTILRNAAKDGLDRHNRYLGLKVEVKAEPQFCKNDVTRVTKLILDGWDRYDCDSGDVCCRHCDDVRWAKGTDQYKHVNDCVVLAAQDLLTRLEEQK